jgi:hypothetical protein
MNAICERRVRYVKAGYEAIPCIDKRPVLANWPTTIININAPASWSTTYPDATNTGIRTKHTPAVDIDIHDAAMAEQIENVLHACFPQQPLLVRYGQPPKRLIPFRCEIPFTKRMIRFKASETSTIHKVEVLGDGQQFIADGVHPDTGKAYTWQGGDLLSVPHDQLPLLDEATARRFLRKAAAVMATAGWTEVGKGNGKTNNKAGSTTIYGRTALKNECSTLAAMPKDSGRNDALNRAAFNMFQLVTGGDLNEGLVREKLFAAATACGLVDEDSATQVLATIESGARAGRSRPRAHAHAEPKQAKGAESLKASAHSWDDPDWSILDDRRGDLPEFPLRVLSTKTQALVARTAQGAGVTPAHVAVPLIGIVSSLIGIARRVQASTSWLQPATCWTAVIGFSGTGKTPGINVTKRAVKQVERDNKNGDDNKRRAHETKVEAAKAARAKWKKAVEDAVETNQKSPQMPVEATDPGKFVPPKLYVSDGTIERFGELLRARPQGLLLLRDELSGLFTNMSRYSGGQDNEFWLEAWNGDSFNVERMGRVLYVDHLLVGIAGEGTPVVPGHGEGQGHEACNLRGSGAIPAGSGASGHGPEPLGHGRQGQAHRGAGHDVRTVVDAHVGPGGGHHRGEREPQGGERAVALAQQAGGEEGRAGVAAGEAAGARAAHGVALVARLCGAGAAEQPLHTLVDEEGLSAQQDRHAQRPVAAAGRGEAVPGTDQEPDDGEVPERGGAAEDVVSRGMAAEAFKAVVERVVEAPDGHADRAGSTEPGGAAGTSSGSCTGPRP